MPTSSPLLALFQNIGTMELLIILGIALLIFGRRLPEVGRSLGRGIVEFRKGIKGIEDEIDDETKPSRTMDRIGPAKPPLTGGTDARVSRGEPVEQRPADDSGA